MIYFDSAATTLQKPESVYAAVQRTMRACASVGRGGHAAADAAARVVYACRTRGGGAVRRRAGAGRFSP